MQVMERRNTAKRELTLTDRLSRLSYPQACKLLGCDGRGLIQRGGAWEIDIDEHVYLRGDLFRLSLDDAVVTITTMADAPQHLHWNCTRCTSACEHVGAAFSLVLEEKMALGLAAPPPERTPVESLGEKELLEQAIADRRERARTERMTVRSTDAKRLWTDYLVSNADSGRTYRVALRGWDAGESFCSCPDFRKNSLGICKHIINVQRKVRSRFKSEVRNRRFRQKDVAVCLRYGSDLELRLLAPDNPDEATAKILRPVAAGPVRDVRRLLKCIRQLTALGREVTIYPDAEEYIKRRLFLDRIESTVSEIRKDPAGHPMRTTLLETELLPYQLDGVAFAVGAGRAILADDMGLGKTIQGIGVAELLAREADVSRVLVICPASLKSQWRSEVHRFSKRDCQLVLGSASERARQYEQHAFFTLCNYEQVLRDILAIEKVKWDLIILDEGQRIKNWEAKTSRIIKGLRSPFALVLTGTPLENRLDDLFSIAEFIDDQRLGPAFRFFNRHRVVDERGKVLGYQNLGALRERLKPILLRRTRATVMKDLPPRTTEIVRVTPTEEQATLHRAHKCIVSQIVNKRYISEMDLLRLQKALLMCRMAADSTFLVDKEEPSYSSKLDALDDLLGSLMSEPDRKVVLFSEWTTMLNLIEPLVKKRSAGFVRLDGSVPQKKRQQLVHTFQKDPDCRLFLTTNAGSTGLNLQAADTVINVDLPWNPAILEQRIARAHRMGQKRPVHVYVFVTEDTIEESLLVTLSAKHELALAVLDPGSDVDAIDISSGMEELKRRLEVLLGAKPDAPVDESEKAKQSAEAERLARKKRVELAGGQMLGAMFSFIEALLPAAEDTQQSAALVESVKRRFAECLEPPASRSEGDDGHLTLKITLEDESALDNLARSVARMLENPVASAT